MMDSSSWRKVAPPPGMGSVVTARESAEHLVLA